jgi:hypothetical protein
MEELDPLFGRQLAITLPVPLETASIRRIARRNLRCQIRHLSDTLIHVSLV